MKKYLYLLLIPLLLTANVCFGAYTYSRTVTFDHTKVGNGTEDESNYPVLVCANGSGVCNTSVSGLNQTGGGALVQNSNGYDIVFSTVSDCSSGLLSWEMPTYVASTGSMEAYVKISTLSHTSDTVIYMCYGNASISTFQGGASSSVWSNNFAAVYHFSGSLSLTDSSGNGNTGTGVNSPTSVTGQIGNGAGLANASSQYINIGTGFGTLQINSGTATGATLQMWFYDNGSNNYNKGFIGSAANGWGSYYNYSGAGSFPNIDTGHMGFNDGTASGNSHFISSAWNLVTITADGTNVRYYINGVLDSTVGWVGVSGGVNQMYLGFVAYYGYLNASIDEARLSNVIRSTGWAITDYKNQSSPSTFETFGSQNGGGSSFLPRFMAWMRILLQGRLTIN